VSSTVPSWALENHACVHQAIQPAISMLETFRENSWRARLTLHLLPATALQLFTAAGPQAV
jgi:hypothetical protein